MAVGSVLYYTSCTPCLVYAASHPAGAARRQQIRARLHIWRLTLEMVSWICNSGAQNMDWCQVLESWIAAVASDKRSIVQPLACCHWRACMHCLAKVMEGAGSEDAARHCLFDFQLQCCLSWHSPQHQG